MADHTQHPDFWGTATLELDMTALQLLQEALGRMEQQFPRRPQITLMREQLEEAQKSIGWPKGKISQTPTVRERLLRDRIRRLEEQLGVKVRIGVEDE